MKTRINKYMTVATMTLLSIAFIACGKKSDNNTAPVAATTYYLSANGQCMTNLNQPVDRSLCNNTTGSYQMINGYCYQGQQIVNNSLCTSNGYYIGQNGQCMSNTGQVADMSLCNNTGTNNGGMLSQPCYGQFYDMYNNIGTCNGQNCAGWILRSVQTNQQIRCI